MFIYLRHLDRIAVRHPIHAPVHASCCKALATMTLTAGSMLSGSVGGNCCTSSMLRICCRLPLAVNQFHTDTDWILMGLAALSPKNELFHTLS